MLVLVMSVLLDIVAGREGGDDLNCFSLFGGIGLGEVWCIGFLEIRFGLLLFIESFVN